MTEKDFERIRDIVGVKVSSALSLFKKDMDARFESIDARLDRLEENQDKIIKAVVATGETTIAMLGKIETLTDRVDSLDKKVTKITEIVVGLQNSEHSRSLELERRVSRLEEQR